MIETTKFIAACVQLNSSNDMRANLDKATQLIEQAAAQGAKLITLPENAFFMAASREESFSVAAKFEEHNAIHEMQALAKRLQVWLLFTLAVHSNDESKLYNRSVLIDDSGALNSFYDKIHLFDVDVKGDQIYRESENICAGNKAVLAELPWGKMGMTICYDLRFPQLFRALAQKGALFLTVPAAFTYKTGEAHWHTLLRARAIENSCFVFAPAQCGLHPRNRQTYGHSLIINPWGKIIAEGSEAEEGIITAEIDVQKVFDVRASLPSLQHDRPFDI